MLSLGVHIELSWRGRGRDRSGTGRPLGEGHGTVLSCAMLCSKLAGVTAHQHGGRGRAQHSVQVGFTAHLQVLDAVDLANTLVHQTGGVAEIVAAPAGGGGGRRRKRVRTAT